VKLVKVFRGAVESTGGAAWASVPEACEPCPDDSLAAACSPSGACLEQLTTRRATKVMLKNFTSALSRSLAVFAISYAVGACPISAIDFAKLSRSYPVHVQTGLCESDFILCAKFDRMTNALRVKTHSSATLERHKSGGFSLDPRSRRDKNGRPTLC
jgi:hypothetical protein